MNRRPLTLKLACLLSPLALAIAALHVWGEGLTDAVGRLMSGGRYDLYPHGSYRVYAPRGSHLDIFVRDVLEEFSRAMVKAYESSFWLRLPDPETRRISVYLPETHDDLLALGMTNAHADLANNGGYFNPAKYEIAIEIGPGMQYGEWNRRGLQHEMTHALLHCASPRAEWSPWFNEGMAEYFENSLPDAQPPRLGGVDPSQRDEMAGILESPHFMPVKEIIAARQADFGTEINRRYYREAHFLVAFLIESPPYRDRFESYYREEFKDGELPGGTFESIFGDPAEVQRDWIEWIRTAK